MDERSYLRVANTLNKFGLWTSWCSQFLTPVGFEKLGLPYLERTLHSFGWTGKSLLLYTDVDPGGGFGYGNALLDVEMLGERAKKWNGVVRDHCEAEHHSYLVGGKRTHCVSAVLVR